MTLSCFSMPARYEGKASKFIFAPAATSSPMLSSIDPNTREIGRTAAETLAEMMENGVPAKQIVRQIQPSGVVARASTETVPVEPKWLADAAMAFKVDKKMSPGAWRKAFRPPPGV